MREQERVCNPNELKYCTHFVLHGNQTEAYLSAYNVKSRTVASRKSVDLHKRAHVLNKIEDLQKKAEVIEFDLTVAEIKKILVTAAQKGLKDRKDMQGNQTAHAPAAAVAAMAEINRMNGNHAATKTEHSGVVGVAQMSVDEFKQARLEMLAADEC